jgi:ABC-type molybdenum transport system ATPase subunit/photorepair protein PhrA
MLASLNHVNLSFGPHEVLKDVTWALEEGEIWGVIGRNGAGKSTVFKLLLAQLESLHSLTMMFILNTKLYRSDIVPDDISHQEILKGIRSSDPQTAENSLRQHILDAGRSLEKRMEEIEWDKQIVAK